MNENLDPILANIIRPNWLLIRVCDSFLKTTFESILRKWFVLNFISLSGRQYETLSLTLETIICCNFTIIKLYSEPAWAISGQGINKLLFICAFSKVNLKSKSFSRIQPIYIDRLFVSNCRLRIVYESKTIASVIRIIIRHFFL